LRVNMLRGTTTHLVLRCAPDGEIFVSIEHVADCPPLRRDRHAPPVTWPEPASNANGTRTDPKEP